MAKAVLSGEYDAGAVMESVAQRYAAEGLAFVATSPPVPEFNFSATPFLSPNLRKDMTDALLELSIDHEGTCEVLESLGGGQTGFIAASDEDYKGIAEMMEKNQAVKDAATSPTLQS